MIYFDTSYLVRLYYADPGADAVRALGATDNIACAAHGQVEVIAAFHRKLHEGAIKPAAYAELLRQLRAHDEAGAFQWLAQGPEIYACIAGVYAKLPSTVYLRAADATFTSRPQLKQHSRLSIRTTRTCLQRQNNSTS